MLVDGVVVVNEAVDFKNCYRKTCLMFKLTSRKRMIQLVISLWNMIRLDFNDKWRSKFKACVFYGNQVVLVNISPSQEINIQRGKN